jgi:hypothetical protein
MLENTEGAIHKGNLDCPFLLPLRYSLTFICPLSYVPYVASFSGLSFFIAPSVFSNIYLSCVLCRYYVVVLSSSCVLCSKCYHVLWIVLC